MLIFLRYFIIIITLLVLNNKVSSQVNLDYSYHAIAGAAVGLYTANTAKKPLLTTILSTGTLAICKEVYDYRHGRPFDKFDIGATVLGGLTAYCFTKLLKRHVKNHRYPTVML